MKTALRSTALAFILIALTGIADAHADCPLQSNYAAPHTRTDFVKGGLVYDLTADVLKTCDGTNWNTVAAGSGLTGGTSGYLGVWSGATTMGLSSSTAGQQLFWDGTNHRLGIGTAAPDQKLHIYGGAVYRGLASSLLIDNTLPGIVFEDSQTDEAAAITSDTGGLRFYTRNATGNFAGTDLRMTIQNTGNVGIGTLAPTLAKLETNGVVGATAAIFGSDTTGVSVLASYPGLGMNAYYNGSDKAIGAGYGGVWALDPTTGNLTWRVSTATAAAGAAFAGSNVRLAILQNGNVGIGTTGPTSLLTLNAGSNDGLRLNNGTVNGVVFNTSNNSMSVGTVSNHPLGLYTNNLPRVTVLEGGNVGIGVTNPSTKLDVAGSVKSQSLTAGGYGVQGSALTGTIYGILGYNNTWGVVCNGTSCGGNQAWTNYSDARLKERVHALSEKDGLDTIMRLRPVRFHWRDVGQDQAKGEQLGLIAQDVQKLLPEILGDPINSSIELPDGSKEEIKGTLNVSYATLVVPLIKAVQQLKAENDNLRAEIKTADDRDATDIRELREDLEALRASLGK